MDNRDDLDGAGTTLSAMTDADLPVRSDADLLERWRLLMGPGGFARRSLWLLWFDAAGRQSPVVVPIDDVPARPEPAMLDGLMAVAGGVLAEHAPGGCVAMALSRPGPAGATSDDLAWGRALAEQARRTALPLRRVHLATCDLVRALPPDDVP